MKEVMAFIRLNMVSPTKEALSKAGFTSFSCRKCLGRGKKSIDPDILNKVLETGEIPVSPVGEYFTEGSRLIPKRFFTLVVDDDQVDSAVRIMIDTNQTGNPGDGKIFIIPITETYRVRTGEASSVSLE